MIAILYDAKKENMFLSFKVCMGLSREIRLLFSFVKFTHGIYMYCFHFVCIYCLEGTGASGVYEIVGSTVRPPFLWPNLELLLYFKHINDFSNMI